MDKKKHILVISQYFYPEQFRINDICEELVKRGYEITVVTGIPNYPEGKYYSGYGLFQKSREKYRGINIIRIPIISRGNTTFKLCMNYLSFVVSGFFWSYFTNLKVDYVYIYEVSPMTQALPGIWYSKHRKIPCYIYVMDLWPENVVMVTGINNKLIVGLINKMVNYIYLNSSEIFVSSKCFAENIKNRNVNVKKIHYWPQYAEDFYSPYIQFSDIEIPQDTILNITFAGNIGFAQGLEILPQTAKILKSKNILVRFNIIGDGRFKEILISLVNQMNTNEYFNFIDRKAATDIPKYLKGSDAALICLAKNKVFEMTIPAKTQTYMACGIPILLSGDGEVQDIIKEAQCGFVSSSQNVEMLVDNIIKMNTLTREELKQLGNNGLAYYTKNFNKKNYWIN